MDHAELLGYLHETKRDTFLIWDSLHAGGLPNGNCHGSWNVYRRGAEVLVSQNPADFTLPLGAEPPVWRFDNDAGAYAFILDRVCALHPHRSAAAVRWEHLPLRLREWLTDGGWTGNPTLGGRPVLIGKDDVSWRMLITSRGAELRRMQHRELRNEPLVAHRNMAVLCALLLVAVGPPPGLRRFGWPRVGLNLMPGGDPHPLLEVVTLTQLADAYADPDGGGLLEVLAPGARVDLLSAAVHRAATRAGLTIRPFGDGTSVTLEADHELAYEIAERPEGHELAKIERGERRVVLSGDLQTVQAAAVQLLDPGSTDRTGSGDR